MKSTFKKIGIAIGALMALILIAIIVIPLVVDVDKYRPQIVETANSYINGKLELGRLSLSLWGQVRVEVGGVQLSDSKGRKIVSVKDAYFHIPFLSVLTGSPVLTFKMTKPELEVVKDKSGTLNVMTLVKQGEKTSAAPVPGAPAKPAAPVQPNEKGASSMALPAIATRARLGVELRDASLVYKDEATALDSRVKNLNLIIKDISLSHPTELQLWADLDTKVGSMMTVQGPAKLDATVKVSMSGSQVSKVLVSGKADLDGLEIKMPGLFEKKKGLATNAELSLNASPQEVNLEKLNAKFFNAEIKVNGNVTNLTSTTGAPANPVAKFDIKSNDIDLKPWNELIPMLKAYDLAGHASLTASAGGAADKLSYKAQLKVDALTAKSPYLKAAPRMDVLVSVITDQIDALNLSVKAPGNDLQVKGKLVSFTHPQGTFEVTSTGMDLDQLINFPKAAPKAAATDKKAEAPAAPGGAPAPKSDLDALLDPLRENKMVVATQLGINVQIKSLQAYNVKMTDIQSKMSFGGPGRELVASIDSFAMKLWGGLISASASTAMKPKKPTYKFSTKVSGLQLKEGVESQVAFLKNTLLGKASFEMAGDGASYNTDAAVANLKAKGNMKIEKATFATIDVGKMVTEGLNKGLEKIAQKIPQAQGKSIKGLPGRESRYDLVASDFVIADSKFSAPNFVGKAEPNQGIDLKGAVTVGIKDYSLAAHFEVVDTYNLTNARELSVDVSGVKVDHILAKGSAPVSFPVSAGCTVMAPCYSYTEVVEHLGAIAVANVGGAIAGRAKSELSKKAESIIQKAPPATQDALKGLGKKLFH